MKKKKTIKTLYLIYLIKIKFPKKNIFYRIKMNILNYNNICNINLKLKIKKIYILINIILYLL